MALNDIQLSRIVDIDVIYHPSTTLEHTQHTQRVELLLWSNVASHTHTQVSTVEIVCKLVQYVGLLQQRRS